MSGYILAPEADAELTAILEYIAARNRTAAARLLMLMEATFRMLADFPSAGRARADVHPDVRSFAIGSYVLIYRQVEDGVEIARIADGRRDLTSLF